MSNKLQELTDRLYNEGLSRGREEGELLLANARKEADEILAAARREAESIVKDARENADKLRSKAESDIRMASEQSLQATRKDIEDLLLNSVCADKVSAALKDEDLIKEMIMSVASRFDSGETEDLSLVLPEELRSKLEPWVASELKKALGKKVEASFSKKISGGFTIGPKDGSWYVSFSDETFRELICEYLRPVTRKLLFG
ncbi:MAG: V-type ATP synthase subunit E family protein [Candidatus Cryptobacteroides sp.]|nr:V-type ATP synthase subunit E family protein [Rikenellaceae bacterium]MDY5746807.1 V-type ATP synthase subunit E family protein [Candidatus Cryptobacteroides sp.]